VEKPFQEAWFRFPKDYRFHLVLSMKMSPLNLNVASCPGFNVPEDKVLSRFAIGRLAIYKRALSAEEGKSGDGRQDAQRCRRKSSAATATSDKEQQLRADRVGSRRDTGGYFRIDEPVAATVGNSKRPGLSGDHKELFSGTRCMGSRCRSSNARGRGKSHVENFTLPSCRVYYLDMAVHAGWNSPGGWHSNAWASSPPAPVVGSTSGSLCQLGDSI
jgi:hypothetical protein